MCAVQDMQTEINYIWVKKILQKADLSWAENKQLSGRFQISPDKDCMLWLSAQSLETFIRKQQLYRINF
jgi:hypothetical protein